MIKYYYKKTAKLSPAEQSEAAYSLLKEKLAEFYNVDTAEISFFKDDKGCPFVKGIDGVFVSVTHTNGLVACAFASNRVGIDAEMISARRKSVEKRVFSDNEISLINKSTDADTAFFTLWTLKESYLKAIGTGFADNAKTVEFFGIENLIISNAENHFFLSNIVDGYVISVCEKTD
ncbi:MAG: 4'-phosphopantetheinyl transferase superfamily protein [Clostridia bacterium]|nr:4'-phosphopantetheinyl transferase superfamily protein [Clostridia bacterium]